MKAYKLSASALAMTLGSSRGTQPKYYDNGFWYKVNVTGYEGLAERLVSVVLRSSNVSDYVEYQQCTIDGRNGCRSKNFLHQGESFISFERLYNLYVGGSLSEKLRSLASPGERIEFTLEFIEENTGLSCREYLSQILTLDMLDLNVDRHLNNLGIIADMEKDIFRTAPVFDNGAALLSDFGKFYPDVSLEENLDKVSGQPFSVNLYTQAEEAGFGLKLDYEALYEELEKESDSRALAVLKYQLDFYRDILSGKK